METPANSSLSASISQFVGALEAFLRLPQLSKVYLKVTDFTLSFSLIGSFISRHALKGALHLYYVSLLARTVICRLSAYWVCREVSQIVVLFSFFIFLYLI